MGGGNATVTSIDPGTGLELARVADLTAEDVAAAVDAAAATFRSNAWSTLPINERCAKLHRLADVVEANQSDLAQIESMDAGKILSQAEGDVANFVDSIRYYADLAQHVQPRTVLAVKGHDAWTVRHPWGPCGFIIPWNFPFLLLGWGLGPALAAGNTVVVKPAEDTPLSTLYVARLAQEAGIPDGVINVVPGRGETTGAALSNNPKLKRMSFTGSPEVGRLVAESCGRNLVPVKCELGGKGAAVIFDDVDLEAALPTLVGACVQGAGQTCSAASRVLVQRGIYDEVRRRMAEVYAGLEVGPAPDNRDLGPLVSAKQKKIVSDYIALGKRDLTVAAEGTILPDAPKAGHYVAPILFAEVPPDHRLAQEEVFGPVQVLIPFEDEAEALRIANGTEYGLVAGLWTRDGARQMRMARKLNVGQVFINNYGAGGGIELPFGGVGKSGHGREEGFEALYGFSRLKTVTAQHG